MNGLFLLILLNQLIVLLKHAIQHLKNSLLKVNVYNTLLQNQEQLAILNKVVVVFKEVLVQQLKLQLLAIQMQLEISVLGKKKHRLAETKNAEIFLVQLMLLVRIQVIRTLKANVQLVEVVNVLLFKDVLLPLLKQLVFKVLMDHAYGYLIILILMVLKEHVSFMIHVKVLVGHSIHNVN